MRDEPEIASAFSLYNQCRSYQLFTVEVVKGTGKQQKVIKKVIAFPTGFHSLPEYGGMLDQPNRLMEYFSAFLSAERRAAYDQLSK